MKKIIISGSILTGTIALLALSIGGTVSFYGDKETSTGNVLAAGAIDLGIDNSSYYNGVKNASTSWDLDYNISNTEFSGDNPATLDVVENGYSLPIPRLFFNFNDLKPEDQGEDTISIHVNSNDAWACMGIDLTNRDDNGITEPEAKDGDVTDGANQGELQNAINFVWWKDDGDNVLETDEVANIFASSSLDALDGLRVPLADSTGNGVLSAGPLSSLQTYYIGKAWCYGDLTLNPVTAGQGVDPTVDSGIKCDGKNVNNLTQTDSVKGDVFFTAVQSRHNGGFICQEPEIPNDCIEENSWANSVIDFFQGVEKNGGAIPADRSDPTDALGVAQSAGTPYDSPVIPGTFFSLGFNPDVALGFGGNIKLTFPGFIVNGPGNDVKAFEVTGGNASNATYPDEKIRIEASQDGIVWTLLAASVARDAEVDLGVLPWAKYVRITDVSVRSDFSDATADGYDLDGVKALNCVNEQPKL